MSHRNANRTSRQAVLRRCPAFEELQLIPEPDNRFDPNAMMVCRKNGEQLGYLKQRLALEMHGWIDKGQHWTAVLVEVTGQDERALGANLALLRAKPIHGVH